MKKFLLIIAGSLCAVLGGVGIFLPILPTTPFLLLAAICYGASSQKLYRKLYDSKYLGAFLRNYRDKTGVPKKIKAVSLVFLWATLGITCAVFRKPYVWIICAVVGIAVTLHILLLRARKKPDHTPTPPNPDAEDKGKLK